MIKWKSLKGGEAGCDGHGGQLGGTRGHPAKKAARRRIVEAVGLEMGVGGEETGSLCSELSHFN